MNVPFLAKAFLRNAVSGFPSQYPLDIEARSESLLELSKLATERALRTREIHAANDYYGHATILKRYAGIPAPRTLKSVVEHAAFLGGYVWDEDVRSHLPAIVAFNKERFQYLEQRTRKKLFAVGPILAYAPHFLSEEVLESEKRRLGRCLLAFPAHSTHRVEASFDIGAYCEHLNEIGKGFDTLRICLYWKDALRGWATGFNERGFECITAGHIFDPLFLPRLKSIIECASFTTSNEVGSSIGHCVLMGKGHFLFNQGVARKAEANIISSDAPDRSDKTDIAEIKSAFSQWCDTVSPRQKEVADRYWGLSEMKSPEELKSIFEEAEALYQSERKGLLRLRDRYAWVFRN